MFYPELRVNIKILAQQHMDMAKFLKTYLNLLVPDELKAFSWAEQKVITVIKCYIKNIIRVNSYKQNLKTYLW